MSVALSAAATALTTAAGLMVVPIVGAMAAAIPLGVAASQLVLMAQSHARFEAQSLLYLSEFNYSD